MTFTEAITRQPPRAREEQVRYWIPSSSVAEGTPHARGRGGSLSLAIEPVNPNLFTQNRHPVP
jgi:hypothetical protein